MSEGWGRADRFARVVEPAPFIPVLLSGGPRVIKKDDKPIYLKGKPEEWAVSLGGQILTEPHPTMGDRASADLYIRLLNEEA